MTANKDSSGCHTNCLIAGVVLGVLVFLILKFSASWGFVMALILGIAVAVLVTIVLRMVLCAGSDAGAVVTPVPRPAPTPAPTPTPQPVVEVTPESEPEPEPEAQEEPEPEIAAAPEPEPVPEPEAAPEPAPPPEPEPEPEPVAAADEPAAAQPAAMDAARDGGPDDLKKIKGVGPKLEQLLHTLGVFHFDQIAGWGAAEVAWMDDNLAGFKGRVTRDDWVRQAGLLAAGGETDFSRKVDEGDVY